MEPRLTLLSPRLILPGFAACLLLSSSASADVKVTTLARLGGEPDGYHAEAAPTAGPDGAVYGTTEAGGPDNCGTIYKVAANGTLTTLYAFTGGDDGSNPVASLTLGRDGNFYGTTPVPGGIYANESGHLGTVFRVTPAGKLTTLHRFNAPNKQGDNADGANPQAPLALGRNGDLYGTTTLGGSKGAGTIFKITPAGVLSVVHSFAGGKGEDYIQGTNAGLALGDDGNFYGSASGGAHGGGIIFRLTPAGAFKIIYTFPNDAGGYYYNANTLLKAKDGALYGTTRNGGNKVSEGTAFRVTTDGAVTFLHNFKDAVDGENPVGALVQAGDGDFYGTTSDGGPSHSSTAGFGTVFQMKSTGTVKVLHTFVYTSLQGTLEGATPAGIVQARSGVLYGATTYGNFGNTTQIQVGPGTLFKLTTAGEFTTLQKFVNGQYDCQAALTEYGGDFLGTTLDGGSLAGGGVFVVTPGGQQATVYDFNPMTDGSGCATGLAADAEGNLFGATAGGGVNGPGGIFELAPEAGASTESAAVFPDFKPVKPVEEGYMLDFLIYSLFGQPNTFQISYIKALYFDSFASGHGPMPEVAGPESLYGISVERGDYDDGAIFSVPAGKNAVAVTYSFGAQPNDGSAPVGMVEGSDGNFYGTTEQGGANGLGTVFKYTPGGTLTTLYSFQGAADGLAPAAAVAFGKDGLLYGTTSASADDGNGGAIFRLATDGSGFTVLHKFTDSTKGLKNGYTPMAPLLLASDGKFYGTTDSGGTFYRGTLFSFDPSTGAFALLYTFTGDTGDGGAPAGALIQGTDGNLYGATTGGGTDDEGVVYKVELNQAGE
jgi:uncharacterized repeat protein (TIGR03803 family)